jgi:hypothetical protein
VGPVVDKRDSSDYHAAVVERDPRRDAGARSDRAKLAGMTLLSSEARGCLICLILAAVRRISGGLKPNWVSTTIHSSVRRPNWLTPVWSKRSVGGVSRAAPRAT